ncbi:alpha-glycosidase [Paenibacillus sp. UMB4589-SE434]|uniref:alpha-glycosidase n=1 Tax=Paenibacillus sp. UMB4589-SE434 TaxID=3046314 RepID=UPI00254DED77|nr:alpha-glycosidase [Paenibacillus sp. UMB4589-SE434]MDK8181687.1 alpha-glycosidase [Paenibacillus sp. UMB4589-SE434]
MLLEAIYHRPKQNWAYAYDRKTIHVRIRTKKNDVSRVTVYYGDKFDCWEGLERTTTISMTRLYQDELFDYWQAETVPTFRRLAYVFKLETSTEEVWMTERGFQKDTPTPTKSWFEYPFLNPVDVFTPPAWVKDAVFYQIFPERFANGDTHNDPEGVLPWGGEPTPDNYFGGDLQGVMDHLDHLAKLGITAIYFTPIFEATTNHKYDTKDYMKVDSHFGSNEKLKELVAACHRKGIRVLLDAVFNHCGYTFEPYVDVLEKGEESIYKDWFHVRQFPLTVIDGIPTFDTFAFTPMMPKLNTENPAVKQYLLEVARYWIEEVGIDGWRLDVANEVDHQFWREFRQTVKAVNPEAYILGEMFHEGMMWLQGDQFDAVMNYPFTYAIHDFFAEGKIDGIQFAQAIEHQLASYPQQANEVMFNLLDSHDTARLLTLCGGDKRKLKLASLFQLTFLGTPCIYYGDEIGLDGGNDPDCRKCMEWDESKQDLELLQHYQDTIAFRHKYTALRTGSFRFLYAKENDRVIAYERADEHSHVIVLLNNSSRRRTVRLSLPQGEWHNEVSGETVVVQSSKVSISLEAMSALILRRE